MSRELSHPPDSSKRLTAFVDASVIAAYLAGGDAASRLFDDGYRGPVQFAVDPVVLQEVLTLPQVKESPQLLETHQLNFKILPLDIDRSQELLRRAKAAQSRDSLERPSGGCERG